MDKLTGRKRHVTRQGFFRKAIVLVLQVEVTKEHVMCQGPYIEVEDYTTWIDARVEHLE